MEARQNKDRTTELLLLFVVIIWAANYPLAKYAIAKIHPFVFNSIRYVTASALIAIFFFHQAKWQPIRKGDGMKLLRIGIIASVAYQVAFIIGLQYSTAGNVAIIIATSPLWTLFISAKLHREKIPAFVLIGMIVSCLGVILIILGSGKKIEIGSVTLIGNIITCIAAMLWGLNTSLQQSLLSRYSASQLQLIMLTIGGVGLTAIASPYLLTFEWETIGWTYYAAAIASGALSIALSNLIWSYAVKIIGPGKTANFNNLVPVVAFILSYVTLHEELLFIQVGGAFVTLVGVWFVRRR